MKTIFFSFALIACSLASDDLQPTFAVGRIVGGGDTSIEQHPHQIFLLAKPALNSRRYYCGGSIYSDHVIITAAHCVDDGNLARYKIIAGSRFRNGSSGYSVNLQKIIIHEKFARVGPPPRYYIYDIAILSLESPLPLNNRTMKTIQLADQVPKEGEKATTTGWGDLKYGSKVGSDILQEVKVAIISNEKCNEDYKGKIIDSMLCAGFRGVGGKDACQGDSGGPLVVNGKLAGVVSWGENCAHPNYPGVYANVFNLRPWLLENIKKL